MYRIEIGSRHGCMIDWALLEDDLPSKAAASFALKKWRERLRPSDILRVVQQ